MGVVKINTCVILQNLGPFKSLVFYTEKNLIRSTLFFYIPMIICHNHLGLHVHKT